MLVEYMSVDRNDDIDCQFLIVWMEFVLEKEYKRNIEKMVMKYFKISEFEVFWFCICDFVKDKGEGLVILLYGKQNEF